MVIRVKENQDPDGILPLSRYSAPAVRGIEGVRRIEGVLDPDGLFCVSFFNSKYWSLFLFDLFFLF
jgi:hypothetical protein